MDEHLREQLLAMAEADQDFRHRWADLDQDAVRRGLEGDRERATRAAELIAEHGWPGRSLVGEDGAEAAWLIVQHADHDVELQERCLELLRDAVAREEASPQELAYLTDRVRVNRGREQVYGTQFRGRGADFGPQPIEDPEGLEERRSLVNLEPFADYEARMHELNERN